MAKINYLIGDLLEPKTSKPNILIVHCVNNDYKFGSGIAGAIASKYPKVREQYLSKAEWSLGDVQYVKIADKVFIANLCGQRGVGNFYETPPVRYEAIQDGFIFIREALRLNKHFETTSINLGRIGAGRAGGEWKQIEEIILRVFKDIDVEINVYTLESEKDLFRSTNV